MWRRWMASKSPSARPGEDRATPSMKGMPPKRGAHLGSAAEDEGEAAQRTAAHVIHPHLEPGGEGAVDGVAAPVGARTEGSTRVACATRTREKRSANYRWTAGLRVGSAYAIAKKKNWLDRQTCPTML